MSRWTTTYTLGSPADQRKSLGWSMEQAFPTNGQAVWWLQSPSRPTCLKNQNGGFPDIPEGHPLGVEFFLCVFNCLMVFTTTFLKLLQAFLVPFKPQFCLALVETICSVHFLWFGSDTCNWINEMNEFKNVYLEYLKILLMDEILHQFLGSLSHYLQGFIHPRWCRISSINSITLCIQTPWGWMYSDPKNNTPLRNTEPHLRRYDWED